MIFKKNSLYHSLLKISSIALCLLLFAGTGCDNNTPQIDLSKRKKAGVVSENDSIAKIRIAVGAMITPKEGFSYYRNFLDYIGEKLNRQIEYVDKESYAEINEMLHKGELDVAFVCSGPYVDGVEKIGVQPIAAPQAYGEPFYYSYFIVPADSPVQKLEDLRRKKFAFTDPQSNTGTLVPTYMLARMNETPDSFFSEYEYTLAHDKSIKAVAMKLTDGAAVDSLIWEYANKTNPIYTSKTKIIFKSPPYGIPPVVAREGLSPDLVQKLRQVFLNVHNDPKGREILAGMMVEQFVPLEDNRYDSVRQMKNWISENTKTSQ